MSSAPRGGVNGTSTAGILYDIVSTNRVVLPTSTNNSYGMIAPQAPRITRTIIAKPKDVDVKVKFELGYVEAGPGRVVQLGPGQATRRATFEIGPHRVTVTGGEDGPHQVSVVVRSGMTSVVN